MKKILCLCLFILSLQGAFAESPVNLGIKAGYMSSKLTTSLDQFNDGSVDKFLVGAFARFSIAKLYIQPEAYFASKGGILKENNSTESFDFNTVDVPVLLGIKLIKLPQFNLRLNAGPVFSFVTKKDGEDGLDQLSADKLKDNYMGVQYGAGIDLMMFSLDARMENSLGDIHSGMGDEKSKIFMITLGIKFL